MTELEPTLGSWRLLVMSGMNTGRRPPPCARHQPISRGEGLPHHVAAPVLSTSPKRAKSRMALLVRAVTAEPRKEVVRPCPAGTRHPTMGKQPDDDKPGASSSKAGPRARSPTRWGSATPPSASGGHEPAWAARRPSSPDHRLGPRADYPPSSSRLCPPGCTAAPPLRGSAARSGPGNAAPK
jgi:hypothetical protein